MSKITINSGIAQPAHPRYWQYNLSALPVCNGEICCYVKTMSTSAPIYPLRQAPMTSVSLALMVGLLVTFVRTDYLQERLQYLHWGIWHEMTSHCTHVNDFRCAATYLAKSTPIGLTKAQCLEQFGNPLSRTMKPSQFDGNPHATEVWSYTIGHDGEIMLRFSKGICVSVFTASMPCQTCLKHPSAFSSCVAIIRKDLCRQYHCRNNQLFVAR